MYVRQLVAFLRIPVLAVLLGCGLPAVGHLHHGTVLAENPKFEAYVARRRARRANALILRRQANRGRVHVYRTAISTPVAIPIARPVVLPWFRPSSWPRVWWGGYAETRPGLDRYNPIHVETLE